MTKEEFFTFTYNDEDDDDNTIGNMVIEQETGQYFASYHDLLQMVKAIRYHQWRIETSENDTVVHPRPHPHPLSPPHEPPPPPSLHQQVLPHEISVRIVQFLLVSRIQMEHVTAIGCSSLYTDSMMTTPTTEHNNHNNNTTTNNTANNHMATLELLAHCLTDDETTWWISDEGLDVRPQYVDFCCVPSTCQPSPGIPDTTATTHPTSLAVVVRMQSVSIRIPPLPYGPMSLREFVIQRSKPTSHSSTNAAAAAAANENDDNEKTTHDHTTNHHNIDTTTTTTTTTSLLFEWETISPTWTLHGYTAGYQTFTFPSPGVDVTHVRLLCLSNQISVGDYDHTLRQQRHDMPQSAGFYSIRFD